MNLAVDLVKMFQIVIFKLVDCHCIVDSQGIERRRHHCATTIHDDADPKNEL